MHRSEFKNGVRMLVDSRHGNRFEVEVVEFANTSIKLKIGNESSWWKYEGAWHDSQNVAGWKLIEYLKESQND